MSNTLVSTQQILQHDKINIQSIIAEKKEQMEKSYMYSHNKCSHKE